MGKLERARYFCEGIDSECARHALSLMDARASQNLVLEALEK